MKTHPHKNKLYLPKEEQLSYLPKIFGPNPWYFMFTINTAILVVLGVAYLLGVAFNYMF